MKGRCECIKAGAGEEKTKRKEEVARDEEEGEAKSKTRSVFIYRGAAWKEDGKEGDRGGCREKTKIKKVNLLLSNKEKMQQRSQVFRNVLAGLLGYKWWTGSGHVSKVKSILCLSHQNHQS